MVLTIRTTHQPATDLGYLLMKNPERAHSAELGFGTATVFFPEATEAACTAALVLEIDPVGLVRGRSDRSEGGLLDQYVNDRPYTANSFFATAMRETMASALNGRSRERQELADTPIPLEARIPALRVRGGEPFARAVFEPLGYEIEIVVKPLHPDFPEWGESRHLDLTLKGTLKLSDLLSHLYVLIPALDGDKHYHLDRNEIDKLLKRGEGWLSGHPLREAIVRRYLRPPKLFNEALERLTEGEVADEDEIEEVEETPRAASLHSQRLNAALEKLMESGATKVLDLGCGEGRLLKMLLNEKQFSRILGMDVSLFALRKAQRILNLDRRPERDKERIELIHGSLVYRDRRLEGYEAAAVVEVVEHLDLSRLRSFERAVFEFAKPGTVVVTTPNRDYNAKYEGMAGMRHSDHRFEWSRDEFRTWCEGVAERNGYGFEIEGVGEADVDLGAPSQMAVFRHGLPSS